MPNKQTPYGITPRPEFKITPEVCETVRKYAANGLTLSQIASVLGVSPATVYDKKLKYPEFDDAYQIGHAEAISKVENAIFINATTPAIGKDGAPTGPPGGNVDAQKFILKTQAGYKENDAPTILIQQNALFPPTAEPLIDRFLGAPRADESTDN